VVTRTTTVSLAELGVLEPVRPRVLAGG
jgi:hypothetical protein